MLLTLSVINLIFLVGNKPYADKKSYYLETFNEFSIFIAVYFHASFMYATPYEQLMLQYKYYMGWGLIANVSLNIIVNIFVVGFITVFGIYKFAKDVLSAIKTWQ